MLTKKDKIKVLSAQISNQEVTYYLEGVKEQFAHVKALTSAEYAKVYDMVKGRRAALREEIDYFIQTLETVKSENE